MTIGVITTAYQGVSLPEGYSYLEVGCALRNSHMQRMLHDDTGDHISERNDSYCELTGLYWLWKNCTDEIRGLCHYRRLYAKNEEVSLFPSRMRSERQIPQEMLSVERTETLLASHDIILLMPYEPGDRTAREDLSRYISTRDIEILDRLIQEKWPDWQSSYEKVMTSHNLSYCNMMIAGRSVFDDYCQFLFTILEQYEKRVDLSNYSVQQRRIYGYVAEVLLNVYVWHKRLSSAYVNMLTVMECYGNTETERRNYMFYSWMERITAIPILQSAYRGYMRHKYPGRYENLMILQERLDQNRK